VPEGNEGCLCCRRPGSCHCGEQPAEVGGSGSGLLQDPLQQRPPAPLPPPPKPADPHRSSSPLPFGRRLCRRHCAGVLAHVCGSGRGWCQVLGLQLTMPAGRCQWGHGQLQNAARVLPKGCAPRGRCVRALSCNRRHGMVAGLQLRSRGGVARCQWEAVCASLLVSAKGCGAWRGLALALEQPGSAAGGAAIGRLRDWVGLSGGCGWPGKTAGACGTGGGGWGGARRHHTREELAEDSGEGMFEYCSSRSVWTPDGPPTQTPPPICHVRRLRHRYRLGIFAHVRGRDWGSGWRQRLCQVLGLKRLRPAGRRGHVQVSTNTNWACGCGPRARCVLMFARSCVRVTACRCLVRVGTMPGLVAHWRVISSNGSERQNHPVELARTTIEYPHFPLSLTQLFTLRQQDLS
jgi:hypothetical protein